MKHYHIGKGSPPNNLKRMLRIMKVFILLTFTCLFSTYAANSYSQEKKLSLHLKEKSIRQVFREIEKNSEFIFVLSDNLGKDIDKKVSVDINSEHIETILSKILDDTDISYRILEKQIVVYKEKKSNTLKRITSPLSKENLSVDEAVKGKVVSDKGEPVIGATIRVKNAETTGTTTDFNGEFSLNGVPPNAILLISYVGFKSIEYPVSGRSELNITIYEDPELLGEVVVVGYSTQRKIHVTGSVAQVSSKDILKVPMPNVSQLLTGKLPGVVFQQGSGQPGLDDAAMLVRGYGTFNNSSPLFLVDGVERSFSHIDPNDIESVSVLKDAAAAAVYGVKGAHGVILVTTKRGKKDSKPLITYNGSMTISKNTQLPEFLTGTEYAYWHNRANELDGNRKWFSDEQIAMMTNGDPSDGLENTNWQKEFLDKLAPATQHNISVNGGTENVRYFASLGMMLQEGIVKDMKFERYNVRTNLDMNPNKHWTISLNLAGRMEKSNTPGSISYGKQALFNPISQALYMYPFLPFEYKGLPTGSSYMTLNPFAAAELSGFQKGTNTMIETSAQVSYSPSFVDGLKLSLFGSYDRKYSDSKNFATPYTLYTYLPESAEYSKTISDGFLKDGSMYQNSDNFDYMVIRPSIEYEKDLGKHHVGGLFLFEWQKGNTNTMFASRWGYPLTDLPELSFGQTFPPISNSGGSDESVRAGYVGRINYSYASKYLLEVAFRQDASYKFPKHSRWGFFPSGSIGWLVSEEGFFKERFKNVNKLKMRLSAGLLGQDNVTPFLYEQYFNLSSQPVIALGNNLSALYGLMSSTSYPSVDLTWEKTRIYNLGVELSMWNGLLSVELDGFYKYTYDILQNIGGVYPSSLGGNYPTIENSGSVDVKGFELQLAHRNQIGAFEYTVSGNLSYSKNRILSMVETESIHPWQSMIGKSVGQRLTYMATGLFQTEEQLKNSPAPPGGGYKRLGDIMYRDMNGDGKLTRQDDMAVGTRPDMPEMMYAFSFDCKFKNFDFSMMWQGAALNDIMLSGMYDHGIPDNTIFTTAFYGNGYNSPRYLLENSWTPENTNARYPRLSLIPSGGNSLDSSWWIEDGAYLRLKNLSIGYTIPQSILSKANIQNLRVYVAGTNLLTFAKFKYLDPESPSVNNGYYPQQRTFSFGLNLTF